MKNLFKAISDKLRAETALKNALIYDDSNPNIYRSRALKIVEYPALVFYDTTKSFLGDANVQFNKTGIDFKIFSNKSDLQVYDIRKQFLALIVPNDHTFYDISDTNITAKTFQFENELPLDYDGFLKVYSVIISTSIIWREA